MNWRLFSMFLLSILALVADLVLLGTEDIVAVEEKKVDTRVGDPLFGLKFTEGDRANNLKKMGFEDSEVKEILGYMNAMMKQYHLDQKDQNVLLARIDDTTDTSALASALCGTGATGMEGATLPVRYEAAKFLVKEEGGQRSVINLSEVSELTRQEWVTPSRIDAIYKQAELGPDRKDDATRMALAAVMAGANGEREYLEHLSGWGGTFFNGWSWQRVLADHDGVRQRLFEYVALMHIAAEQARTEGGLCKE